MPRLHEPSHQILAKLVLFGLPGSGRAGNLRHLCNHLDVAEKGALGEVRIGADSTLMFEFMLPQPEVAGGHKVRFQLFSTTGKPRYRATHELLLRNADGVVLVVDADRARLEENKAMIEELGTCMKSRTLPPPIFTVQFNHRVPARAIPSAELRQALEIPPELPVFEARAHEGVGVFETLNPLCQAVLEQILESTGGGRRHERPME